MLFGISRADVGAAPGRVRVRVSYAGFASAYGGDFGARLALFAMPACALTTPRVRACQAAKPLRFRNNSRSRTLTATVAPPPADAAPLVLSAQTTLSGGTGDYRATSLAPGSSWQVGLQSGDFTYSYPLRMPPPIAGAAPSVAFSYDSQTTDGETAQSNSQPGQLGEGFSLAGGGYIERRYASCADHVGDASNNTGQSDKTGDLCWDGVNGYLSLGGHSGQLVRDSSGTWHLGNDDGSIVRQINGGTANGAFDNSHWEIITPDGTQYWFGLNQLPGYQSGDDTNSVWTVPVVGLKAGDPCNDPGSYAGSVCDNMPWRWNLDLVVDPNGNATSYYYAPQTGYYAFDSYFDSTTGENQGNTFLQYTYGGQLTDIYYGSLLTPAASGPPTGNLFAHRPFHVALSYSDRCTLNLLSGNVDNATCDANHSSKADWPDVPWDAYCGSSAGNGCSGVQHNSPAFFDTQMLMSVATSVFEGSSPRQPVSTWNLAYQWLPGDAGDDDLALYGIAQEGNVSGTLGGSAVFFPGSSAWTVLPNRGIADGYAQIERNRLVEILSNTGAQTNISYNTQGCPAAPPDPATNTYPCFPQTWEKGGIHGGTIISWFNKYTVSQVTVTDTTGGSPPLVTSYVYCSTSSPNCTSNTSGKGGAWHYDTDADLVPPKEKSYAQWRGYRYVHVITGSSSDTQSETDYTFLRGMDSDPVKDSSGNWTYPGVTVTPSDAANTTQAFGAVIDSNALNGFQLEKITYNGPGGPQVSDEVDWPWIAPSPTAQSATQTWGQPFTAYPTGTAETDTYAPLSGGGTRQTQVTNTFDPATGLLLTTDDKGDRSDSSQELCTTRSYPATPSPAGLINYPTEVKTTACGTAGTPLVSNTKYSYDTLAFGAAPTAGNITETDVYSAADHWVVQSRDSYDAFGRLTCSENAFGSDPTCTQGDPYTTGYSYSSNWGSGSPTTTVTTQSPLTTTTFATTTSDLNPAWGSPTDSIDASGQTTSYCYDSLGEVTAIWLPGQAKTTCSSKSGANYIFTYQPSSSVASYVETQRLISATANVYVTSYQLYDSLLRPRQTQTFNDFGNISTGDATVTDTLYDSRGNVAYSNGPYGIPDSPSGNLYETTEAHVPNETAYTYDGAGRQTKAAFLAAGISQWNTATVYSGSDEVTTTPPAGGTITSTYTDARDRTTEIDQYHSKTSATGNYDATTYSYGYQAGGSTKTVNDAGGNQWTWTSDLLGRIVSASDPDTGTTASTWNDLDQLTSSTDAAGNTTTWHYDAAGRKVAEYDTTNGPASASDQLAAWTYDTATLDNSALPAGTKAIGQLASETSYVNGTGGEAYKIADGPYSPAYAPETVTYTIPASSTAGALAGQYSFNYGYDSVGNLTSQSYPAAGGLLGETVGYKYDDFGYPSITSGSSSAYATDYATDALYDIDGQVKEIDLGTAGGPVPWDLIDLNYDTATRRPSTSTIQQEVPGATGWTNLTNTTFNYDHAGNLTGDDDSLTGDHQCYTYDYLARLTAAWTQPSACPANPSTPPGATGLGSGPAPYQQTLSYDTSASANGTVGGTTGRVTDSTLITVAGSTATSTDVSYVGQYPAYGGSQPHAPTSYTTTTGGTTVATAQSWTPDGQLSTSGSTSYNWNGAGMPPGQLATVSSGGTVTAGYRYDASGNLLLEKDGSASTLFLPDEELYATGSTITGTRYYTLGDGGRPVAARTSPNAGSSLYWLFSDPQGTSNVRINASTGTSFFRYFTPYGAPRGTVPWWPGDRSYVGGTADATTKLTNLGAREYNPGTPAFISPDPILDPSSPSDLDPYDYAQNNPATGEDPSGEMPTGPNNCGDVPACIPPGPGMFPPEQPTGSLWDLFAGYVDGGYNFVRDLYAGSPQVYKALPDRLPIGNPATSQYQTGGEFFNVSALFTGVGDEAEAAEGLGTLSKLELDATGPEAADAGAAATPRGFANVSDFEKFGTKLKTGLAEAGYPDTQAAFQGSSVTGVKFTTGAPFDVGRQSDFDIALTGNDIFGAAQDAGIGLRSGGIRTGPLGPGDLERLGLTELRGSLSTLAGRPVNFMIYRALGDALSRSPSLVVP
jgi:RHS repeat-associated protein